MKRAITILAALLASCSTGEEVTPVVDGAVKFTSDISTRVSTDLSDNSSAWEVGDQIGIYMQSSDTFTYSNVMYSATTEQAAATTDFTVGVGEAEILIPNSISSLKFYAYSPYSSAVSEDYSISIDLSDQSTEAKRNAVDFMVAASSTYTSAPTTVELKFEHKLAMLKFNVECGDTLSDLTGLTCAITGLTTTQSYEVVLGAASLGIATDGTIAMWVDETSSTTATVTAIVHTTTAALAAVNVEFTLGAQSFKSTFTPAAAFEAGQVYSYEVTLGSNEAIFSGSTITAWGSETSDDTLYPETPDDLVYNGTEFEINSAAGLFAFADLVNGGDGTYSTATVDWGTGGIQAFSTTQQLSIDGKLTKDIELNSVEWTAIGSSSGSYKGTFDGGDYLVSGLYIRGSSDIQGLFGYVGSGGVVKNLGVSGEVTGSSIIGGVVGENSGTVTNCYNTAKVSGTGSG
ncbi:MAG: fimbrillin family protein, partial [Rikenellaceae bacterium]